MVHGGDISFCQSEQLQKYGGNMCLRKQATD